MKVTCLTESISRLGGGLFDAERRVQQAAFGCDKSIDIEIVGMLDEFAADDQEKWQPLIARTVRTAKFPPKVGYSKEFGRLLSKRQPDVVYSIGLWKYFSKACLNWHEQTSKPYLIAPHGMLDPWAMENHKLRKKVLLALYQRKHLEKAACIRALNVAELNAIRRLNLKNPVCIIPNGVDLPPSGANTTSRTDGPPTLLFLGRLHPKKGVLTLIDAWQKFVAGSGREWKLKIVGWGDESYCEQVKTKIEQALPGGSIEMTGPLFGDDKQDVYSTSSAFILPSHSEGMPMTVLEAWANRLPVIMTPHCNIPEGVEHNASLECQPELDSILASLNQLAEMNSNDRAQLAGNGRSLVEQRFTWSKVGAQLAATYHWMAGKGDQPEFVVN